VSAWKAVFERAACARASPDQRAFVSATISPPSIRIGARTHRFDFIELVRRDQDRLRLAHPLDEAAHRDLLVGIEPVGRLIEDQHRRIMHNGAGQRDAPAIALRQSLDRPREHIGDGRVFGGARDRILRLPAPAGRACARGRQESPSTERSR
jgi:hypothetical protein